MNSSTQDKGLDAAREAVKRYEALPRKEKKRLKDSGVSLNEVLLIMFLQIGAENAVNQGRQ